MGMAEAATEGFWWCLVVCAWSGRRASYADTVASGFGWAAAVGDTAGPVCGVVLWCSRVLGGRSCIPGFKKRRRHVVCWRRRSRRVGFVKLRKDRRRLRPNQVRISMMSFPISPLRMVSVTLFQQHCTYNIPLFCAPSPPVPELDLSFAPLLAFSSGDSSLRFRPFLPLGDRFRLEPSCRSGSRLRRDSWPGASKDGGIQMAAREAWSPSSYMGRVQHQGVRTVAVPFGSAESCREGEEEHLTRGVGAWVAG